MEQKKEPNPYRNCDKDCPEFVVLTIDGEQTPHCLKQKDPKICIAQRIDNGKSFLS